MRKLWPHLVAAFIVLHVTANCIDAIPNVAIALNRKNWEEPRVKRELDAWALRLGVDRATFEDRLFALGTALRDARSAIQLPVKPYLKLTGMHQSWAMFVAGSPYSDRFQLRARRCGLRQACPWIELYTGRDDASASLTEPRPPALAEPRSEGHSMSDAAFMREVLEHPRVRSATFRWAWPASKRSYTTGCRALARRAFAADQGLVTVQCRFELSVTPPPDAREVQDESLASAAIGPEWRAELNVKRSDVEPRRTLPRADASGAP